MTLTGNDYREIASLIEDGAGSIEYEKGGETLYLDYVFERDGYVEDDRENGTGGWVETSRSLYIADAEFSDAEGNLTHIDVDESALKRLIA